MVEALSTVSTVEQDDARAALAQERDKAIEHGWVVDATKLEGRLKGLRPFGARGNPLPPRMYGRAAIAKDGLAVFDPASLHFLGEIAEERASLALGFHGATLKSLDDAARHAGLNTPQGRQAASAHSELFAGKRQVQAGIAVDLVGSYRIREYSNLQNRGPYADFTAMTGAGEMVYGGGDPAVVREYFEGAGFREVDPYGHQDAMLPDVPLYLHNQPKAA